MTYSDSIQFLYRLQMFGAKLGLETPRHLAALAGNPERQLRFIHVAGTNGKGSTCAMLESIYRAAGWRVGLFTSPHLLSFTERLQINRRPIPPDTVARLMTELHRLLDELPGAQHATFFEVVTVLALRYFAEERCDLVIWETGLGGRLDATNIVTPLASAITEIAYDHQQWLGSTLDQIAAEKAGIIKPGVPVVTSAQPGQGLEVIAETARQQGAPLTVVQDCARLSALLDSSSSLALAGPHQKKNAALALAVTDVLAGLLPVNEQACREGLSRVSWPGRFQIVPRMGGRTVVLDGAHNLAGATALHAAWTEAYPGIQPALVLGFLADKDWAGMARKLAPLANRILLVPVHSARALAPRELMAVCQEAHPGARIDVCGSVREALQLGAEEPWLLVAGSLYLIGETMEELGVGVGAGAEAAESVRLLNERGLNEWSKAEAYGSLG